MILREIGYRELDSFKELARSIGGIASRVLSLRLKQLMREGLVERKATPSGMAVWHLTLRGRDLLHVLEGWVSYRTKWDADKIFHRPCSAYEKIARDPFVFHKSVLRTKPF